MILQDLTPICMQVDTQLFQVDKTKIAEEAEYSGEYNEIMLIFQCNLSDKEMSAEEFILESAY